MEYLIAVDLEGVNYVKGEAYSGLRRDLADYKTACEQAVLEINSAVKALFDGGATKVVIWDNHAGGNNLDFSKIDARAEKLTISAPCVNRFEFCKNYNFVGCVFIGYHSKEGTINGILAHTYNSSAIQYFKFGNKTYGEFEMDATIASEYGIKPLFASGDDIFIKQVNEFSPATETVVTKIALGRNEAEFNDNEAVLNNIYNGVLASIKKDIPLVTIPVPTAVEIRYTRMERAKEVISIQLANYNRVFTYGDDAHTIKGVCNDIEDIKHSIIT